MKIGIHDIGVCSWSLRAEGAAELIDLCQKLNLNHAQLNLGPLLDMDQAGRANEIELLRKSGLTITSGMIGFVGEDYSSIATIHATGGVMPDALWPQRLERALAAGRLAQKMKLSAVSTHIGFIPSTSDPNYPKVVARVGQIASEYAAMGLDLYMETGQEKAANLHQFIKDVPGHNLGANFDPANMILYGSGDPIEAVHILRNDIRHVHIKDATASIKPGVDWGQEVPFGQGQVGPKRFLDALTQTGYKGPLVIEREAGPNRMEDIRAAIIAMQQA